MNLSMTTTTLIGWFEFLESTQFEPKIFHPDFSLVNLAGANVCIGACVFLLLLVRRCFPMAGLCRHSLREATRMGLSLHTSLSLLIWVAMLVEGKAHERATILAMGINVFLVVWNRALTIVCDSLLERRLKELAYRKAIDDAVVLYDISEAHCKEVVTDARTLRSFLTLIHNELNHRGVHDSVQRALNGKKAFDDLVARERLHRSMIDSPHIQENMSNWRKFMALGKKDDDDEEEEEEYGSMEKVD